MLSFAILYIDESNRRIEHVKIKKNMCTSFVYIDNY